MFPNLLIDESASDQILVLTEQTWEEYQRLTQSDHTCLISYLNKVINIVSPSRNHERIATVISLLINAYCRKYQIPYFSLGSKDIKKPFVVGKQADASYCFGIEKDIPDLAIEVNYTSGSINDLSKYQLLNVPEVWIWQNDNLSFYLLEVDKYVQRSKSSNLSLDSAFLNQFVNRALTEDNLTLETEFFAQLP